MNKRQRLKNRETSKQLAYANRQRIASVTTCPECGEKGFHWVQFPQSVESLIYNEPPDGFWTCAKFYENGRRKAEHVTIDLSSGFNLANISLLFNTSKLNELSQQTQVSIQENTSK